MSWDSEEWIGELSKIAALGDRHRTEQAFKEASPIYGALIGTLIDNHEVLDDGCTPFADFLEQLTDKQVDCFCHLADSP